VDLELTRNIRLGGPRVEGEGRKGAEEGTENLHRRPRVRRIDAVDQDAKRIDILVLGFYTVCRLT
jgi:hypothetical protein